MYLFTPAGLLLFGEFLPAVLDEDVDDKPEGADGDGGVGDVEDGVEEEEVFAAEEGEPLGPVELEKGEVEHIDHLALEEGGVAAFGREEGCHREGALAEYQAIETAVDEVAHGTGKYQCQVGHHDGAGPFLEEVEEVPQQGSRGHKAEEGKDDLACCAAEGGAEGEALVLDEMQQAPVAQQGNFLSEVEMGLDPDFHYLVDDEDGGDEAENECVLSFTPTLRNKGLLPLVATLRNRGLLPLVATLRNRGLLLLVATPSLCGFIESQTLRVFII